MGVLDRLKRRREFLVVASQGRKWVTPGLILQAWRRDPAPPSLAPDAVSEVRSDRAPHPDVRRVGFTVSRKVGTAVVRNRVRRRLKAAAEAVMPLQARATFDYVLIGRQQTMTRSFPDLLRDLETALRKTGAHAGEPDDGAVRHDGQHGGHRPSRGGRDQRARSRA